MINGRKGDSLSKEWLDWQALHFGCGVLRMIHIGHHIKDKKF